MLPEVRRRIEEVLGVRGPDQYGLNDGGLHACEGQSKMGCICRSTAAFWKFWTTRTNRSTA